MLLEKPQRGAEEVAEVHGGAAPAAQLLCEQWHWGQGAVCAPRAGFWGVLRCYPHCSTNGGRPSVRSRRRAAQQTGKCLPFCKNKQAERSNKIQINP